MNKSIFLALGCVAAIYGAQPKWGILNNAERDAKRMNLLKNAINLLIDGVQQDTNAFWLCCFDMRGYKRDKRCAPAC